MGERIPESVLRKAEGDPSMRRLIFDYRHTVEIETLRKIEKEIGAVFLLQVEAVGRGWALGLDPQEQAGLCNLSRARGWMAEGTSPEPERFLSNDERNRALGITK